MRLLTGILLALALCLTPLACGNSSKDATPIATGGSASVTAYFPHDADDRDNDGDHNNDDYDLSYGHAANPTDRREPIALVRRYYAAAAAGNGAEACAMLVPFFAEAVVERYGDATAISGKTCAVVMSKLFKHHHALLAPEDATLRIPEVRIQGDTALVILEFPTVPEVRWILLRRIGGAWRVLTLLDSNLE